MQHNTQLPFIIAHRGASGSAPENTLAAISKAAELGCEWIEVDGTCTVDEQAVIHHDDDIDRCSNGTGLLLAHSLESLSQIDFGSWFDAKYCDEKIPTLSQCLERCQQLSLGCNMEIKVVSGWEEPTAEIVCQAIARHGKPSPSILISSFSPEALKTAQKILPNTPRAYLSSVIPRNWEHALESTGSTALHCGDSALITEKSLLPILNAGYPLRIYTVDDPERAATLKKWGVASIFTNHPERMKHLN